ncbi:MAG: TIGR00725 family protein [Candidatus Schekmanbacteria bacterium]|nr:MAG: TIGR00725 family protein [Candidatus Schekmanbacteria bacterium]
MSVIGGANCTSAEYDKAEELGQGLAELGAVVVCGGLGGVMEAVCKGAKEKGGITVGILPGEEFNANPYVDITIVTGLSHARNVLVARSGICVVAVGGGYGTLSEIAIALKLGKRVIGIDSWNISDDVIGVSSVDEALSIIEETINNV